MSDPKETPAERPKLWERRDDKPADPPAENPPTDGPRNKPDLLPRDPDNPTPDPEPTPTPKVPTDLPKIATERLMDVDVDGDGIPDRMGGRDPILGDDDDLGDIVAGGPPVGQTVAADSAQSTGGVAAPQPDGLGNLEIQDVFDTAEESGRLKPTGEGLNYEEITWTVRDGGDGRDMTDRPVNRFEEIKVTARDDAGPLDDVVGVRDDSGEESDAGGADDAPGVVVSGGSTMVDAPGVVVSGGSTMINAVGQDAYDAASPYLTGSGDDGLDPSASDLFARGDLGGVVDAEPIDDTDHIDGSLLDG